MVLGDDCVWLLFPLDKTQHIRMTPPEVGVLKLMSLYFRITLQDALLEVLNLVETVHVQLTDERGPLVVFEPFSDDLSREAFVIQDLRIRVSVISGAYQVEVASQGLYAPVNESPSSDHLIIFEFSSSLRILRMTSVLLCKEGTE